MEISGWGRYPRIMAKTAPCFSANDVPGHLSGGGRWIAHGLGRSYGDSALAGQVLLTQPLDRCLSFDAKTGLIECEAGRSLAAIVEQVLPKGWFLPVTPGTKHVTIGGAVASDVHGKNHHVDGCFSTWVTYLDLLLPNGRIMRCAPDENAELFHATCGGMGLTGIILKVALQLRRVSSAFVSTKTLAANSLAEVFDHFEQYADWHYLVAWVDCLANPYAGGRFLLFAGEHAAAGGLLYKRRRDWPIPKRFPSSALNRWSGKVFNALYYRVNQVKTADHVSTLDQFFYPLDGLADWNRLYGKKGFLQYQLVLPKKESYQGLARVFAAIGKSGQTPFLGVLKLMGKENDNLLTFPLEGYTLALDFKASPGVFSLLQALDGIVSDHGGRLYLTKDARMGPAMLAAGYPRLGAFRAIRERYGLAETFQSLQAARLAI